MTIYRFDIDGDQDLDGVLRSVTLAVSGVLDARFPDHWEMTNGAPLGDDRSPCGPTLASVRTR